MIGVGTKWTQPLINERKYCTYATIKFTFNLVPHVHLVQNPVSQYVQTITCLFMSKCEPSFRELIVKVLGTHFRHSSPILEPTVAENYSNDEDLLLVG